MPVHAKKRKTATPPAVTDLDRIVTATSPKRQKVASQSKKIHFQAGDQIGSGPDKIPKNWGIDGDGNYIFSQERLISLCKRLLNPSTPPVKKTADRHRKGLAALGVLRNKLFTNSPTPERKSELLHFLVANKKNQVVVNAVNNATDAEKVVLALMAKKLNSIIVKGAGMRTRFLADGLYTTSSTNEKAELGLYSFYDIGEPNPSNSLEDSTYVMTFSGLRTTYNHINAAFPDESDQDKIYSYSWRTAESKYGNNLIVPDSIEDYAQFVNEPEEGEYATMFASTEPNKVGQQLCLFEAFKPIPANTELTALYGVDYHDSVPKYTAGMEVKGLPRVPAKDVKAMADLTKKQEKESGGALPSIRSTARQSDSSSSASTVAQNPKSKPTKKGKSTKSKTNSSTKPASESPALKPPASKPPAEAPSISASPLDVKKMKKRFNDPLNPYTEHQLAKY